MSTAVERSRPSDPGELLAIAFQRTHESDHIKPASIKAPSKAEVKDWATAAHMVSPGSFSMLGLAPPLGVA